MTILFFKGKPFIRLISGICLLTLLCGCKDSQVSKGSQSEEVLVYQAKKHLNENKYQAAIEPLKQLSNSYQVSANAQLYKIELMHAEYQAGEYVAAIETADQFFSLYPFEPNSDYALYVKVKASLKEFSSRHWMPRWVREHYGYANSEILKEGMAAADLLMSNYPKSKYISEVMNINSRMKEILLKRDFNIAGYYKRNQAYAASLNRLAGVIGNTDSKKLLYRALVMAQENYTSIGETKEAEKIKTLIEENWK